MSHSLGSICRTLCRRPGWPQSVAPVGRTLRFSSAPFFLFPPNFPRQLSLRNRQELKTTVTSPETFGTFPGISTLGSSTGGLLRKLTLICFLRSRSEVSVNSLCRSHETYSYFWWSRSYVESQGLSCPSVEGRLGFRNDPSRAGPVLSTVVIVWREG